MQLASERDRDRVYRIVGEHSRDDAAGVVQMCYVGVINPGNPRVESAQEVCDALVRAANFIPKERLGSTDDCGFSPFSIDEKPNHGSPDYAREVAFQKIKNRVEGTRMAAEKLGLTIPSTAPV
jgi:methionine synthase II (cobalamin-independent)